jgi:ferredoxin-nitrite reductase
MHTNDTHRQESIFTDGLSAGAALRRALPVFNSPAPVIPVAKPVSIDPNIAAGDRQVASGKKLTKEEEAKRKLNGLDVWDLMTEHARDGRFPRGTDLFLFKFQGMFHVAPAQDSFMCRLRFAGGMTTSTQFRGVADLADAYAAGHADVTTRANLQVREIGPRNTIDFLIGLADIGIINRGSGADNIRNVTASPTAGMDPDELIDTRPLARQMHHYILNHREMYGLPRKFNIAFDGGGRISALEDTNDIGFVAVRVADAHATVDVPPGVYFRLQLGGITGHKDFARDSGVLLKPDECVPVAAAIVRVFIDNGDRNDRKKARLKYVLDRWGIDRYLSETEKYLPTKLRRFDLGKCEARTAHVARIAHVGFHPQKQPNLSYVGVVLPVGRMTSQQMRGIANIADRFGSGAIRLTVWQNLLISDIPNERIDDVKRQIEALGLHWSATNIRASLIACTGSAGCKFAAANTKKHAMEIAAHVEQMLSLDMPVNIHLTGCPNSCAQHYIGDIGLIGTKVGEEAVEGYHLFVGGGYGSQQAIGREFQRDVKADEAPAVVERLLRSYLQHRLSDGEGFQTFVARHTIDQLHEFSSKVVPA